MNAGLFAMTLVAAIGTILILRDPAIRTPQLRAGIIAGLIASVAVYAVVQPDPGPRFALSIALALACAATLGRPALVIDWALTDGARADARLTKRAAAGSIALLVGLVTSPLLGDLLS